MEAVMNNRFLQYVFKSSIILVFIGFFNLSFAIDGGRPQNTTGATGVINVTSADVVSGFSIGAYIATDFDGGSIMPRLTFGWRKFEFFGGFNYGSNGDDEVADGNIGIKWQFYNNDKHHVRLALMGNVQFNDTRDNDNYFDGQVLIIASWNIGQFETHFNFGATFGDKIENGAGQIDVGFGTQWWFLKDEKTKGIFNLALAADFTNYDFHIAPDPVMDIGSAEHRGNFSAALRFGFLKKTLIVDVGGMDLLDLSGETSFYTYIGYNASF